MSAAKALKSKNVTTEAYEVRSISFFYITGTRVDMLTEKTKEVSAKNLTERGNVVRSAFHLEVLSKSFVSEDPIFFPLFFITDNTTHNNYSIQLYEENGAVSKRDCQQSDTDGDGY